MFQSRYKNGAYKAARKLQWCGLCKTPVKDSTKGAYVHMRLVVKGILKQFLNTGDSRPTETEPL
jgi:hypothetical protein